MKNKSIIGLVAAVCSLTLTTSCEDMLTVDSNRVVYEEEHTLSSTADSVYTTNGILQSFQQIADRYILLGELRGDLVDVNDITQAMYRNIAEFKFDTNNELLNPTDYYAVINNCNYLLKHMDVSHKKNGKPIMLDEYAAALSIRAWTYMQLAINYGKVPFYTEPLTKVADAEDILNNVDEWKDIKGIAEALIPELEEHIDTDMPSWASPFEIPTKTMFPPIKLVLGDLNLWAGNYDQASFYFLDFLANRNDNQAENYSATLTGATYEFEGYMGYVRKVGYSYNETTRKLSEVPSSYTNWLYYGQYTTLRNENFCAIAMSTSSESGTVSLIKDLFWSANLTHQLVPSASWVQLVDEQNYYRKLENKAAGSTTVDDKAYAPYLKYGDARGKDIYNTKVKVTTENDVEYTPLTKFSNAEYPNIVLYRRAIVYLRAAEALNSYAAVEYQRGDELSKKHAREHVTIAFNFLKDAYQAFYDINAHTLDAAYSNTPEYRLKLNNDTAAFVKYEEMLREDFFQGVHARGCGEVHLDTVYYTLTTEAISEYLGVNEVTFQDTIAYVEERILDELALEAPFEGNRFGDLIRFAERRDDDNLLIDRVANRSGEENADIRTKLLDKANWYLPLPKE